MAWLTTTVRRSIWIVLIAAAGGAVWTWRRDTADVSAPAPAEWPPLTTVASTPTATPTSTSSTSSGPPATPTVTTPPVTTPPVTTPPAVTEPAIIPVMVPPDTRPEPSAPSGDAASSNSSAASVVNALVDAPEARSTDPTTGGWADPFDDGTCPISHPIKANDNSGIFHMPHGRSYDRTRPQRCYSDAAAALADGYRHAKN